MAKKDEIPWPLSEFAKAGQDIGDAFVGMVSAFIGKFASVVNRAVGYSGLKKSLKKWAGKVFDRSCPSMIEKNAYRSWRATSVARPAESRSSRSPDFSMSSTPSGKTSMNSITASRDFDDAALFGIGATLVALFASPFAQAD